MTAQPEPRGAMTRDERFRLMVEGVRNYAIFMLDPGGRIATWNLGAERLKGYRADEIIGRHLSTFYTPDAVQVGHPDRELELAARDGSYTEEGWRVRKDGSLFWADVTITALREDGELVGYSKVTRDLTERKRREEALRGSEEKLRAIVEASRILGESLDYEATLAALSRIVIPTLADWYGVELVDDDGGRVMVTIAHADPAKVEVADQLRRRYPPRPDGPHGVPSVIRTGQSELYGDISEEFLRAATRDEHHYQLVRGLGIRSGMVVPLRSRGRVLGAMTLVSETAGRYGPDDLAFAEELGRRAAVAVENARLYQDAQRAIERAHDAIRARDDFLQVASHELKTPLTPLQLQLDALARTLDRAGVRDERIDDRLAVATRQVARLGALIERILDVSRIATGEITLDREELDLGGLVRAQVERLRGDARQAGGDIEVRTHAAVRGRWDRARIEQVVANLVGNAVRYGNGKPIDVTVDHEDGVARVAVTDRGIGIAADAVERIFGRYERAVSVRHFGGLGLGLFIARRFAEAHGGTIEVISEPGVGSTFTLVLPVDGPAPGAAAEATS